MKARIAIMLAATVVLAGIGVAPQLQARLLGKEYVVRVAPVDPIDPFRGAYVALGYPDLQRPDPEAPAAEPSSDMGAMDDDESGPVYISLRRDGEVWVAEEWLRARPDNGPYLACTDRDWRISCGIESLFLSQDKAREVEKAVAGGTMLARLKVDSRGHAVLLGLE